MEFRVLFAMHLESILQVVVGVLVVLVSPQADLVVVVMGLVVVQVVLVLQILEVVGVQLKLVQHLVREALVL